MEVDIIRTDHFIAVQMGNIIPMVSGGFTKGSVNDGGFGQ